MFQIHKLITENLNKYFKKLINLHFFVINLRIWNIIYLLRRVFGIGDNNVKIREWVLRNGEVGRGIEF